MKTALLVQFVIVGFLFIGLSIPLIRRRVPPNRWYGFRVRKTLEDPDVWYPANEYAGWRGAWFGVVTVLVSTVFYFMPGIDIGTYGFIIAAVVVAGCVVLLIQSLAYIRRLPNKEGKRQGGSD